MRRYGRCSMRSLPVISTRKNGDRLLGYTSARAQELYSAGTPPVHGLAAKPAPSAERVAELAIGDRLRVELLEDRWQVSDAAGPIGVLRWLPSLSGKRHAVTGDRVRLPERGWLIVERVLVSPDGVVKDVGGYVEPDD